MKKLDQDKVTTYAKLSEKIKDLVKKHKAMRAKFIAQMERGYTCPKAGPYILVLDYQDRHPVAWKEEWMVLARKHYGKKWKDVRDQIVEDAELVRVPELTPKINAKYRTVESDKVVEFRKRGAA